MKTLKFNSFKTVLNLAMALVFLVGVSCGSSDKKAKPNSLVESNSKADAPEIDIHTAILTDNMEVLMQHIKIGTDLNEKEAMSGSTPLITAVSFGKNEMTKALVDAGADLTLTNNDGATPLHTAAFLCRVEIVKTLLAANADKTLKNNYGATPRASVMGDFSDIKPVYEMLKLQFEPIGLQIDLDHIEKTRPVIADLLK